MSNAQDQARVRQSALRVGALVGAASAVAITVGVVALVAVLLLSARPDHDGNGAIHDVHDGDRVVVDVDHVLPWVVGLGIAGVIALSLVAWLAARWAVRPLAGALALQRTFVADASHELRTPLTALTSRVQILERRHARGEPIEPTITALRRDAATMGDILSDMLITAEGDAHAGAVANVADCLTLAVSSLQPLAQEHRVHLVLQQPAALRAALPDATLTRFCVALIDNAIQHAPAESDVLISTRASAGVAEIRVADGGSGISDGDTERIFERFARSGETGRRRGFGLGLALVREGAARFGGIVRVETTSTSGTTFLLTVPLTATTGRTHRRGR